ncbi:unnamed protein product [Urochloa humidicola]
MERSKHGDGSLYERRIDFFRWQFDLGRTTETSMEPMRLTLPTAECVLTWTSACGRHVGGPMLQIFSVKLAKLPRAAAAGGPIQLYGLMAIRDLMDHGKRNYVFNRSRDDPFVISDPFFYLPGPKRGVNMQGRVVFEYYVRIKSGEEEHQDLSLIDEVAIFSEKTCIDEPTTFRISGGGGGGAVDITWARLTRAMEATVEVRIRELRAPPRHGDGNGLELDLCVTGSLPRIAAGEEIKLFRGVVDKPCALDRFVIAVSMASGLMLHFKAAGGGGPSRHMGDFAFRVAAHGSVAQCSRFDLATVEVKAT